MSRPIAKTKRTVILSLALFFLLFSLSCQAAQFVTIAKDGVNIRKGPTTKEEIVMELFEGWPLRVVNKKNDWYEVVDYEKDRGWVYAPLVRKNDTVIVNVKKTGNMRSGPGKNSPVIAEVERGVVLTRITVKDGWVKVKHSQGSVGWIYKTLLWPQK
ncbi:SH3 domain-containing protein [Desulfotalea psychrophila]|uniref:SH3b domain-containing protein n=1 Tax=Desulfotalea psychrophila (strain LSv54 / DSM 12343) TaxID=177439 RepID=Q6AKX0_DESPS|nr:SH3 domain-containing protein [Desulfotalea psychrophila]CAG37005.1 hypothetical protein DP2276 [Desulfotalea psychrophila LSv54]